jgi:hypothetical protein
MIPSQRKDRKAKAIAEALALIAGTGPGTGPGSGPEFAPLADSEDERLWDDATAFGAALEKLFDRHLDRKAGNHARRRHGIWIR